MEATPIAITVSATIAAPVEKVWNLFTAPEHIVRWNAASPDWHTTKSENDLVIGGKFSARMEAKDGSFGFDFWGIYDAVTPNQYLAYTLGDNRKVSITFTYNGSETTVVETFEAETQNSVEIQQFGWQAIMNSFKDYVETN